MSLLAAYDLALPAGAVPNETFRQIADRVFVPYDDALDYHPEYLHWNESAVGHGISLTKQADTVLMQYPLAVPMNKSTAQNDLDTYARVTDPTGPAMTVIIRALTPAGDNYLSQQSHVLYMMFSASRYYAHDKLPSPRAVGHPQHPLPGQW